ncbi:hypothetical protein B0I35DRAFT_279053 [Stachybotrys elegans]|uniref:Uncharacterized protein n=1 Tax=Stachybotrys elegans TaxID=80388 RepID=A0A8K0SP64_9HYPO|nr:hypothetical protein B0I35DRAFT_279053 [Stachybotrys elegans]
MAGANRGRTSSIACTQVKVNGPLIFNNRYIPLPSLAVAMPCSPKWHVPIERAQPARGLIELLGPVRDEEQQTRGYSDSQENTSNILAAIQGLVSTLSPGHPLFAAFHDGQVHHHLGAFPMPLRKTLSASSWRRLPRTSTPRRGKNRDNMLNRLRTSQAALTLSMPAPDQTIVPTQGRWLSSAMPSCWHGSYAIELKNLFHVMRLCLKFWPKLAS